MTKVLLPNVIYCCVCRKMVNCSVRTGKELYPHRSDLYDKKAYQCPFCHNTVGMHKGTMKALGVIPTPEIKRGRRAVHSLIDPLWKCGAIP